MITITGIYDNGDGGERVEIAISDADKLWLRGYRTWDANEGAVNQFSREGYEYKMTVTLTESTQWKIASNDYKTLFGLSTAISAAGTYDLTYNGEQAGFNLPKGTYDLTFDFSTLKLTVAAHSETPTYPATMYYYDSSFKAMTTVSEGVYEYTLSLSAMASFRFYSTDSSSDDSKSYGTSTNENVTVSLDTDYDVVNGNKARFEYTPAESGNYKVTLDLTTNKVKVTRVYPTSLYLYRKPEGGSSSLTEIKAKDGSEGVYEATITLDENTSFRFYSDSSKADAYSYGPTVTGDGSASSYLACNLNEATTMVNGCTNRWQLTNTAGEYTFTVDLKNLTFKVVAKSSFTDFWLVGEETKDGDTAWSFVNAFKFNTTDGVNYTLENVSVTANKQFKISDQTRYFGYGTSDGQLQILPGNSYNIYIKDGSNDTKNLAWYSSIACNVNITFTLNESDSNVGNIKVEYVYPDLYLRGGFNPNGWDNLDYKMTLTDGVYTYGPISLSNCEFKIGSNETGTGNPWTWGFGSSSTVDGGELAVDADGVDYTIYDVKDGKNLKIGEVSGTVNITFTPDLTNHRGTLRITRNYTPGEGITVYVVAPYEATGAPYIYRNNDVAAWPGEEMSKEVGLYYFDGTDTRDVYTYSVDATSLQWIISDGNAKGEDCAWRYPANNEPQITVTESTVIIFTSNTSVETKAYDSTLFTNVSGIEDVEISNEAPVEFYNLQGVR
ncbi:MAG: hypothetical protein ACI31C_04835, partial [Muribaculaceae bacterium]